MKSKLTPLLARAAELLLQSEFTAALKELREVDLRALDDYDQARFCVLLVEASIHSGDYSGNGLDNAILVFRQEDDYKSLAKAKHLEGGRLNLLGKPSEAKEPLMEAYVLYRQQDDSKGVCLALNHLAQAYFMTGQIDVAIANLRTCLSVAEENGYSDIAQASVMNLAYMQFECGRIGEAIESYKTAVALIGRNANRDAVVCHMMSALPHALRGDFTSAKKCLERSRQISADFLREQAICFENEGLINILSEEYEAAQRALQYGLDIAMEIAPESALVSQIRRLFGDLYLATERSELAEKHATEALAVAEKIDQKVEIAASYRILAQVEARRNGGDRAVKLFKMALDLFNLIGSQYELAVTRFAAACSNQYSHVERVAMLYLAREYFESEKIEPFLKKIDRELSRVDMTIRPEMAVPQESRVTIVTRNARMKSLLELARHVAPLPTSVLLTGETGTGKDLLARYIHEYSGRRGEFVSVNAAAIPDAMVESELFGYRKGAFTGADRDRQGLLEQAESGTFYLNEIADATPAFQAKLLELLDTGAVRRLGENKPRTVAFRLIAATNHDLKNRIKDNLFRLDLYHRLNQVAIHLPSLADRLEDVGPLVSHFAKGQLVVACKTARRSDVERLAAALACYSWPGNIRQLLATLNSLAVTCHGDIAQMACEAARLNGETEEQQLLRVLNHTNWNRSKAAEILGLSEGAIRKRIEKYGCTRR